MVVPCLRRSRTRITIRCESISARGVSNRRGQQSRRARKRKRTRTVKIAHCAPDMQAYVERFIQTLRNELLHHFVIFVIVRHNHPRFSSAAS